MDTITIARQTLAESAPKSNHAMQLLVTAMADVSKNAGKHSLFGKDKGIVAYEKFKGSVFPLIVAIWQDGIISEEDSYEEIVRKMGRLLVFFAEAYPNWRDAYTFGNFFFFEKSEEAVLLVAALHASAKEQF